MNKQMFSIVEFTKRRDLKKGGTRKVVFELEQSVLIIMLRPLRLILTQIIIPTFD